MPRNITIQGTVVSVEDRYTEGHTLVAAEAKALNQMRAENIRNNCAPRIKALKEAGYEGEDLANETQSIVDEVAANYQFSLTGGGGRSAMDPLEREAMTIAKAVIANRLAERGTTVKAYRDEVGKDGYDAKVAEVAANEQVVEAAKKAIAAREDGIGDLDI